ncbi:MAG: NAD(P)-binding domain-containing protein [Actinobacteria bacterium]|nr:NAD(P)-binding domain-containing protein [Actinomycetota bacterium]
MAPVSVIGLGAMGSTLARVLAERGHAVTVWNRSALSAVRAEMLKRAGVRRAATPAQAIAASPLTVMCVLDYPAAEAVLDAPGATESLAGRTLVQLTNGGEDQVRGQMARVRAAGGRPLAGGIVGYPRHIGKADTVILYAGSAAAFDEHRATLADLAGGQRFLGEDPAVQNATYVSAFGFYYAALAGFLESAALAASRGVAAADFAAVMPGMTALLLDHIADAVRRIEAGDFAGDQATVDVHLVGSSRRQRTLADAGVQSLMTDAFVAYCRQAHEAGEGGEDIAALYKRIVPRPAGV